VCVCVYSLIYPASSAYVPYYIAIFGLMGCVIFFYIISQKAIFSEK